MHSNLQLAHGFHQRSTGYLNKMDSFFYRESSHTFCDVRGNGYDGTLYLVCQGKLFVGRELLRESIHIHHQLNRTVIYLKFSIKEILHILIVFIGINTFLSPLTSHHSPLNHNSKSPSNTSCQGRPCLLSCSMNGSGSKSSTFHTPGLRQMPLRNIIAPIIAGTPVV